MRWFKKFVIVKSMGKPTLGLLYLSTQHKL